MQKYQASIKTPFAHLAIRLAGDRLAGIDFIDGAKEIKPEGKMAAQVCRQIRQYLDDPSAHRRFSISCAATGTPFQKKVWNELDRIPCGKVITYGELAQKLHTSARAVGNACRRNPIPVVVPCHRVVSASGIGGYSGETGGDKLRIKAWLLRHEGAMLDRVSR